MSTDEEEAEQWAFEAFAEGHPHECYALDPERFWEYFHGKLPFCTREQMVSILKETEEPK